MKFLRIFLFIFLIGFTLSSCDNFSKVLKSKDQFYKLEMADKYYADKKYKYAQQLYEELYPIFKGTPKFEDIYYKSSFCYFYLGQYLEAQNYFKGFIEVFPNSPKAEEVDYMNALCFYKMSPKLELDQTATMKAIGMMQTFINTHPGSEKIKEATEIIDKCRQKLELKDLRSAELYYKIGHYRAAAIAYTSLLENYPESTKGDLYKLNVVKSYYQFARLSIVEKQEERFEKVLDEYEDFVDRFPDSKLLKDGEEYNKLSINHLKAIKNEQAKTTTQR